MPNWFENMFKQRASTTNVIAFTLILSYCFIAGYDIIANGNKDALTQLGQTVQIVISSVLIIKGVQTNTEK